MMRPENKSDNPSLKQIRQDFRRILNRRTDIGGAARIIGDCLFEPRNIFDPNSRRKLKAEILIVLSYLLLIALTWAVFNSGESP